MPRPCRSNGTRDYAPRPLLLSLHFISCLLTPDWRYTSHASQIGYLLAMINGDVMVMSISVFP